MTKYNCNVAVIFITVLFIFGCFFPMALATIWVGFTVLSQLVKECNHMDLEIIKLKARYTATYGVALK